MRAQGTDGRIFSIEPEKGMRWFRESRIRKPRIEFQGGEYIAYREDKTYSRAQKRREKEEKEKGENNKTGVPPSKGKEPQERSSR